MTTGRTRQNKLVHFHADDALRPGTTVRVDVTGAGAHSLRGSLHEVLRRPRLRTRIPVAAG